MNIDFINIIIKKNCSNLKGLWKLIYKLENKLSFKGIIRKLKKMKKNIRFNPPSFELLWSFSCFIKYLEIVFLYAGPNVYSVATKKEQNSFVIYKKDKYRMLFNLDPEDKIIEIIINREHGSIPKTVFKITPEFKIENDIDAELFLVIEETLVDTMIDVLKYSYENCNL